MSCNTYTLSGLSAQCKNSIGGIREIYIGKYDDLFEIRIDEDGLAIPIMLRGCQQLYKFELKKGSSSMTSSLNKSDGAEYYTNQLVMNFGKMDTPKRMEIMALAGNDVFVLLKDNNGKIWLMGKDEPVNVSAVEATTGGAKSDANTYTVTLSDDSKELPFEVKEETLQDLLTDWENEYFTIEQIYDGGSIKFSYDKLPGTSSEDLINVDISVCRAGTNDWHTFNCYTDRMVDWNTIFGEIKAGDKLWVKSDGTPFYKIVNDYYWSNIIFTLEYPIYVYGNINSLVDGDDFNSDNKTTNLETENMFFKMFKDNSRILSHPTKELVIPYDTLNGLNAFANMFFNCTNLEFSPNIKITNINCNEAFDGMFYNCSKLKMLRADWDIYTNRSATSRWCDGWPNYGTFITNNTLNLDWHIYDDTDGIPHTWKTVLR